MLRQLTILHTNPGNQLSTYSEDEEEERVKGIPQNHPLLAHVRSDLNNEQSNARILMELGVQPNRCGLRSCASCFSFPGAGKKAFRFFTIASWLMLICCRNRKLRCGSDINGTSSVHCPIDTIREMVISISHVFYPLRKISRRQFYLLFCLPSY